MTLDDGDRAERLERLADKEPDSYKKIWEHPLRYA
jgi:hypothetical protein